MVATAIGILLLLSLLFRCTGMMTGGDVSGMPEGDWRQPGGVRIDSGVLALSDQVSNSAQIFEVAHSQDEFDAGRAGDAVSSGTLPTPRPVDFGEDVIVTVSFMFGCRMPGTPTLHAVNANLGIGFVPGDRERRNCDFHRSAVAAFVVPRVLLPASPVFGGRAPGQAELKPTVEILVTGAPGTGVRPQEVPDAAALEAWTNDMPGLTKLPPDLDFESLYRSSARGLPSEAAPTERYFAFTVPGCEDESERRLDIGPGGTVALRVDATWRRLLYTASPPPQCADTDYWLVVFAVPRSYIPETPILPTTSTVTTR
ncbi:hypothetical protein [Yinghuangia soli]|uniref:Uncharacterized protein n=1 Tax=Yinghuangia soli TaxID=2908204 RepID=A0AA41PWB9_9ACTN|nr:hypothetical protein [Yinghuangia soli]MCF2525702.1 hypothetical protein [Yinghuangia soli]